MSRYLEDQKQVLKRSSSATMQEGKTMKIELTSEGIRIVRWCNKERVVIKQHCMSTLQSLDRDTVASEGSHEEEAMVIEQEEGENRNDFVTNAR